MTTSEVVFYNSSWLIPVFKLSVELNILTDSYRPFELTSLSPWKNTVLVGKGVPCLSTQAQDPDSGLTPRFYCSLGVNPQAI